MPPAATSEVPMLRALSKLIEADMLSLLTRSPQEDERKDYGDISCESKVMLWKIARAAISFIRPVRDRTLRRCRQSSADMIVCRDFIKSETRFGI